MRIVVLLLAVVVGLGLIVVVIGYLLPVRHVATVRAHIPATPEQVWSALTDVAAQPEAPTRLVTRITDKSLAFGGSWEYLVTGDGAGSRVQITEHGEVYNPVFRFVSRFIMGHSAPASAYLKALSARFGGDVTPEVVAA